MSSKIIGMKFKIISDLFIFRWIASIALFFKLRKGKMTFTDDEQAEDGSAE
jgi:hypothetical protein